MFKSLILKPILAVLASVTKGEKNLCNSQNFPFIKIHKSHQDVCILK